MDKHITILYRRRPLLCVFMFRSKLRTLLIIKLFVKIVLIIIYIFDVIILCFTLFRIFSPKNGVDPLYGYGVYFYSIITNVTFPCPEAL